MRLPWNIKILIWQAIHIQCFNEINLILFLLFAITAHLRFDHFAIVYSVITTSMKWSKCWNHNLQINNPVRSCFNHKYFCNRVQRHDHHRNWIRPSKWKKYLVKIYMLLMSIISELSKSLKFGNLPVLSYQCRKQTTYLVYSILFWPLL